MHHTIDTCALFFIPSTDPANSPIMKAKATLVVTSEDGTVQEVSGENIMAGAMEYLTRTGLLRRCFAEDIAETLRSFSWNDATEASLSDRLQQNIAPDLLAKFNDREHTALTIDDLTICLQPFLEALANLCHINS